MKRLKQILLFFIGLAVIPMIAVFITNLLFQSINFIEHSLWEFLVFDYALVYLLYPALYRKNLKKYIPNKYVFCAILFSVFWFIEVFLICFYD